MTGPVSKRERQAAVLEIVRKHRVSSQEALKGLLADRGVEVTQATLSRDIRDLRLVKVPAADGTINYTIPVDEWDHIPQLDHLLPTLFVSSEAAGNLLVIRTLNGGAQAVASGIDWEEYPGVLGTIAGDDTILLICRTAEQVDAVEKAIEILAGKVS